MEMLDTSVMVRTLTLAEAYDISCDMYRDCAVTVAIPGPTLVITPNCVTIAIFVSLLYHTISVFVSPFAVAVNTVDLFSC